MMLVCMPSLKRFEDLAVLSVAVPFMFTHLTATHSDKLICTDASSYHLGAVSAPVDSRLHKELWRLRNRKGWVGHLVGEAAECAFAKGHEKAAAELGEELLSDWDAQHVSSVGGPARHFVESWDYVERCCGNDAFLIDARSKRCL